MMQPSLSERIALLEDQRQALALTLARDFDDGIAQAELSQVEQQLATARLAQTREAEAQREKRLVYLDEREKQLQKQLTAAFQVKSEALQRVQKLRSELVAAEHDLDRKTAAEADLRHSLARIQSEMADPVEDRRAYTPNAIIQGE